MKKKIELRELQSLYDLIPEADIRCVDSCSACCGPVVASRQELNRAPKLAVLMNDPLSLLAAVQNHSDCGTCPYVAGDHLCAIYDNRPFLCRLFGMIDGEPQLTCNHGLRTTKPLNRATANKLLNRYNKLLEKDETTAEMLRVNSENWAALRRAGYRPWGSQSGVPT